MNAPDRIVFAAAASSSGKTTLSLLFSLWARQRGLKVAAYKCGPDFIDSQYLAAVSGNPSVNLDEWMTGGAKQVLNSFALGMAVTPKLAVIEGVMGLYDGKRDAAFGQFSTASVAKLLKAPVVICLSARKSGVTLATQLLGLQKADKSVQIVGAVLNDCASQKTYDLIAPAIKKLCKVPVFGYLPRIKELELPERHLGLSAPSEVAAWQRRLAQGLAVAEKTLDLPAIAKAAHKAPRLSISLPKPKAVKPLLRLGIAKDEAFHFYYHENLSLLEAAGVELVPFSPLHDAKLPEGLDGALLGGGFPESFGEALEKNEFIRREIGAKVLEGWPVWVECGGLMYLAGSLTDLQGKRHQMAGALAADVLMTKKLQNFGYLEAKASVDCVALAKGKALRGHEFHHSQIFWRDEAKTGLWIKQSGKEARREGWLLPGGGIASYAHLHLASLPGGAAALVKRIFAKRGKHGRKR